MDAAGKRSMYYVVMPNKYYNKLSCHILHCHALAICQLPSCNLFTQHACYLLWRDTTSELWTPVHSFTLIKTPTAIICSLLLSAFIIILHTIRLILCIQQAGKIDNLPVSLGQTSFIVLCAGPRQPPNHLTLRRAIFSGAVDNLLKHF